MAEGKEVKEVGFVSKALLVGTNSLETGVVEVEGLGKVNIRGLSSADLITLSADSNNGRELEANALSLANSVMDENGNPLMTKEEATLALKNHGDKMMDLIKAIMKFNKLGEFADDAEEDAEEVKKN